MLSASIHLHPTAPLAERVLLPGDPGRALALAQALLAEPKMFNHNRGLWGYSGEAPDGELLTIQSTGMGGPSAAIVISELADLGARRMVRVGTCGAFDPALRLGELIVVTTALCADGTSRAISGGERVTPSGPLTEALLAAGSARPAVVVSTDLFYEPRKGVEDAWVADGAAAVEMEAATLLATAGRRQLSAAAVLIVSDLLRPQRVRIDSEALRKAELRMGAAALEALSAPRRQTRPA